jgi:Xaa-Pro aminopeptidase
VAFGANAANPHYEPVKEPTRYYRRSRQCCSTCGRDGLATVFADQTWMGFSGAPPEGAAGLGDGTGCPRCGDRFGDGRCWKEAGLPASKRTGRPPVIEKAGWGDYFVHRTGHSIDRDLHGSGPHLDDYETHDDRELIQRWVSRSNPASI